MLDTSDTWKAEMLWIDLETTGLNAQKEVPLELGLAVTDSWGKILRENSWLIMEGTTRYKQAIDAAYDHKIVGPMHEKSGLWMDLERETTFSRRHVDRECTAWLEKVGVDKGTLPMAGSSIGSLDRPFVLEHFPILNSWFHYRNIDVSSIAEVAKLHNNPVWAARPQNEDGTHRVLEDIRDSIKVYRFLIKEFLLWET